MFLMHGFLEHAYFRSYIRHPHTYMPAITATHLHGCRHSHTLTWLPSQPHPYIAAITATHLHDCLHNHTLTWQPSQSYTYMATVTATHLHGYRHSHTLTWLPSQPHTYMAAVTVCRSKESTEYKSITKLLFRSNFCHLSLAVNMLKIHN